MRLSSYMRGLGIGMVVAALLMGVSRQPVSLTDREIKEKARKLGMVEKDSVPLSNALPKSLEDSISLNDVMLPVEEKVPADVVLADSVSADAVKTDDVAETSGSSLDENLKSDDKKDSSSEEKKDGSSEEKKDGSSKEKKDSSSEEKKSSSSEEKKSSSSEGKKSSSSEEKKDSSSEDKKSSSSEVKKSSSSNDKKKDSSSDVKKSSFSAKKMSSSAKSDAPVAVKNSVSREDKYITIAPGDSSTTVANKLEAAGIIRDAAAFDSFLCEAGYDRRITTGKKMIPAGASEVEIAGIITVR